MTLVLAVDNIGRMYSSYTHANCNQCTMGLVLKELVEVLDKESPEWRSDSVILLDNARYHKGEDIKHLMELY